MLPPTDAFVVKRSFRVPGLGLLVLPALPLPAWLGQLALHTPLQLSLHRPGQPDLLLPATIEEIARDNHPPTRALLLDADPDGPLPADCWLEIVIIMSEYLRS